jgi:hypothetical protein
LGASVVGMIIHILLLAALAFADVSDSSMVTSLPSLIERLLRRF